MSYDIGLYRPEFLRRAIAQRLGDWTDADPIPENDRDAIAQRLLARGYVEEQTHPQFGRSFLHPEKRYGIQVGLYRGSVHFAVPFWDDCANAIMVALEDAEEMAESFGLALHDPQVDGGISA